MCCGKSDVKRQILRQVSGRNFGEVSSCEVAKTMAKIAIPTEVGNARSCSYAQLASDGKLAAIRLLRKRRADGEGNAH